MLRDQQPTRILFLGGDRDSVLGRVIEVTWPGHELEAVDAAASAWLARLGREALAGAVALTDRLGAPELHALEAMLAARPDLSALLLVGSRGLAGFEGLLELENVRILPEPWTPAGLEKAARTRLFGTSTVQRADRPLAANAPEEPFPGRLRPGDPNPARPEEPEMADADLFRSVSLAMDLEQIRELQAGQAKELGTIQAHLHELRRHLAAEDTRKSETIQAQMLEIANLRNHRKRQDEEHAKAELLQGVFLHRDRLAHLLQDVPATGPRSEIAATLRSLDEFLATQGIVTEENPDPGDPRLVRVVGSRPRTPSDPPADRIVRKPAFYRIHEGERRVLRPAEIETLT